MQLFEQLSGSERKRHDLLSWCTEKLQKIEDADETDEFATTVLDQLDFTLRKLATIDETDEYESHYVAIRLSQLYNICLLKVNETKDSRIFDSYELMTMILNEDNIDDTKKVTKKNYTFKVAKDFAATILIQMFETFGNQIFSLTPLLFTLIFKNLKKMMEKNKYLHATFMTTLLKLYNAILRNCKDSFNDSLYNTKFIKLSKNVFYELYNDKQDYPVDFIATIIDLWVVHFTNETFTNDYSNNITQVLYTKFIENEIGIYGFSNDISRLHTSRSLAEILFDYYFIKKIISLNDVWDFYVKLFTKTLTRDTKSGCFESCIHFIGLCSATDKSFFDNDNYLKITRSLARIVNDDAVKDEQIESISRSLRYLNHMHKILLHNISESSKKFILFKIMNDSNNRKLQQIDEQEDVKEEFSELSSLIDSQWVTIAQLELTKLLIASLSSSYGTETRIVKQIITKLFELSVSDVFMIRVYSIDVLKDFLTSFPEFLTETIETSLNMLISNYKDKTATFNFSINHGHALIIANLIDIADKNYVSYELIMRITVFATAFTKQHTTSTHGNLYHKGLVCWILLIGLMNYKDEQYLTMQTNQLFLFWKVLLNHSFTYRNEDDLYKNLEIRNHAMTCLLTYLNRAPLTTDLAKQISILLTKCSNFNHSIHLKSTKIDNVLLMNENRILQIYLKIHSFVKADFNSLLLILIVKNFSNPNLYSEIPQSLLSSVYGPDKKTRSKEEGKMEIIMETTVNNLLRLNDGFAFGLSSKINNNGVFGFDAKKSKIIIQETNGSWPSNDYYWYSVFEDEVLKPISPVLLFDYLSLLYGQTAFNEMTVHSPKVTTSVIDCSMELFSFVFPYLNTKIQYSVIENLNLAMLSKNTTPLRRIAIAANACVSLYNALKAIQNEDLLLERNVGQLIIDSIKRVDFHNDTYLMKLKADIIGLSVAAMTRSLPESSRKEFVKEHTHVLINSVADTSDPHFRSFFALTLAIIYKLNHQITPFEQIYEVISALAKDPHPVVHSWSLQALHVLLEKQSFMDTTAASALFNALEEVLVNPAFGMYGNSVLRYNYNQDFNSYVAVQQITKTLTETIGPNIPELPSPAIDSFKNITISAILSNNILSQNLAAQIYENLATFKLNGLFTNKVFIQSLKSTVIDTFSIGIGASYFNSTFTKTFEIIPNTSSLKSSLENFQMFIQLFKLQQKQLFVNEMENLSWMYLALHPGSQSVRNYFVEWLEYTYEADPKWLKKLFSMFDMPRRNLFQKYYSRVNELLEEKGITIAQEKDIKDVEEQNINQKPVTEILASTDSDKLQWQAKLILLTLINNILENWKTNFQHPELFKVNIPNLINISCQASSTEIKSIKELGLVILQNIMADAANIKDPENADVSILEQQEAQITSALMPTFDKGSSPDTISAAINVAAEFLVSNVAPISRLNRIARFLVELLTVFNEKHTIIKVGESSMITQKARRNVELAVLNAWANIIQRSIMSKNEDLIEFSKFYWDILIPLWIISLREYVLVKYTNSKIKLEYKKDDHRDHLLESKKTKLELYEPVWLNFVEALGLILKAEPKLILNSLQESEVSSFMFILFTQCLEEIVLNIDDHDVKRRVLPVLHNVLGCEVSLTLLFEDNTNQEIVAVLDRLILTGDSYEKSIIVDIIDDLIRDYTEQNTSEESFLLGIDKVYELLRLLLTIVSELLPFVNYNSMDDSINRQIKFTAKDAGLLKKAFAVFESNVSKFNSMFKLDLYACLLFIIGRVYEAESRDDVVPIVLPLLKAVTNGLKVNHTDSNLLDTFYHSTKFIIFNKLNNANSIASILMFLSNGYNGLSNSELKQCEEIVIKGLKNPETQVITAHGLKSVFINQIRDDASSQFILAIISEFAKDLNSSKPDSEAKIIFELIVIFAKAIAKQDEKKRIPAMSIAITFAIWFHDLSESNQSQASDVVMILMKSDPETFKTVIKEKLPVDKRTAIERIINLTTNKDLDSAISQSAIELKSFH